ncbi:MAG: hypothetical protein GWN00_09580 [Aliifodinibius sp.]|nr:hypothetical protein [Fodinibius sp.]NIV11437.1 hypothetical protein [Fodinibius sp.]NIY25042.1 hypothetical protein [Fodinibius sp.]
MKGKKSTFDGQNWSAWTSIQEFELPGQASEVREIDAIADDRGLHLVWCSTGTGQTKV